MARELIALDHRPVVALQRVDNAAELLPPGVPVIQAPVWPRLLRNVAPADGATVATMGDILVQLGLDRAETLAGLVNAWLSILDLVQPDLIVADFAPALLMAARGRAPRLLVATGFERAPLHLGHFPTLTGAPATHDERATLDRVNRGLTEARQPPLADLPAMFEAERTVIATFGETDIYAPWRQERLTAPQLMMPLPPVADGGGDEVFVYAPETVALGSQLWHALAASGLRVRVHIPGAGPALIETITSLGMIFEPKPLAWTSIVERSRLVVSHGGLGFASTALVCGLPQVIAHSDLEKRGNGEGVRRAGLGGTVPMRRIRVEPFAASLKALYEDEGIAARARAAAPSFRARAVPGFEEEVRAAVRALVARAAAGRARRARTRRPR